MARRPNCNVLVNPHPRCPKDVLAGLNEPNMRIVPTDIASLIPLCDVYVASMSATISMVLACGLPVINYDVYRYGYDDFARAERIEKVVTRQEFEQALPRMLSNLPPAVPSPTWGVLDGRVGQRLLKLFDRLIAGEDLTTVRKQFAGAEDPSEAAALRPVQAAMRAFASRAAPR